MIYALFIVINNGMYNNNSMHKLIMTLNFLSIVVLCTYNTSVIEVSEMTLLQISSSALMHRDRCVHFIVSCSVHRVGISMCLCTGRAILTRYMQVYKVHS